MKLNIEIEREDDGRWIADMTALPGALAYGSTRDEAIARAEALALRIMADRLDHSENGTPPLSPDGHNQSPVFS